MLSILARNQLGHFSLSDNSVSLPSSPSSALNTQKHQYTCHVCLQNFGKESALESHLQSAAHNDRVARISELVQVGCVDPSKPIADYPGTESTPYAKTIAEVAGHLGIVKDPKQEKVGYFFHSFYQCFFIILNIDCINLIMCIQIAYFIFWWCFSLH